MFVFKERELALNYLQPLWAGRAGSEGKSDSLLWQLSATLWPKLRWVVWLIRLYYMTALFSCVYQGGEGFGRRQQEKKALGLASR